MKHAVAMIQQSAQQQQAALERLAEQAPHLPEIRGQLTAVSAPTITCSSEDPAGSNITATLTPKLGRLG